MAQPDNYNPGQEGATITASPNLQTVQARYDPNADVNSLVSALGAESTQKAMGHFKAEYDHRKLQEQTLKIDGYSQQFMQDHQGGAVSQAQLKERFPEMVPVIAARVAESIGKKQGALDVASTIEEINGNDSLRLDTAARTAFIAKKRADLFGAIPEGNDFYAAGVAGAMDRSFQEQELKWQGQTAAYHEQVQKTALGDEAVKALSSADPKAAMAAIDANYGKSSSLNNLERNKVYVDAVIKLASVSDDPSILAKIPQAYLNIDSKAQLRAAGISITNQQIAQFTHARALEQYQRDEIDRKGKLQILQDLGAGAAVDPGKYLNSPGLHAYAVEAMTTPSLPEATSKAALQDFRQQLLTTSNVASLGSQSDITKAIMGMKGKMNPKDMAALVDEVPKLMEGTVLMNDPGIRRAYTDNIGFRLDDMAKAAEPNLQKLLNGSNIRGNAMALFEGEIRGNFEAAYKETGQWPTGFAARKITDAAVAKTSAYIDTHVSLKALSDMGKTPAAASTRGGPMATPSAPSASPKAAPSGLPKGVTQIK